MFTYLIRGELGRLTWAEFILCLIVDLVIGFNVGAFVYSVFA